jgi:hypothetical protein
MTDEKENKVVLQGAADSAIKPSDFTRMAPAAPPEPTETKRVKTIKLKPLQTISPKKEEVNEEETVSMTLDRSAPPSQPMPAPSSESPLKEDDATVKIHKLKRAPDIKPDSEVSLQEEETVKLQKIAKPVIHVATPIPGVKQTVKLRPSSSSIVSAPITATAMPVAPAPEEDIPTAPISRSTLKLTPVSATMQTIAQVPPAETAEHTESVKRTIKLVAKKPSAPTMKTPEEPSAESVAPAAPSNVKKTIKLTTRTSVPPPPVTSAGDVGMATEHGTVSAAPSDIEAPQAAGHYPTMQQAGAPTQEEKPLLALVAASIAVLIIGYIVYIFASQYNNLFMKP